MQDHPVPNQSNRNTNEALTSLVRLLAVQAARDALAASAHDDFGDLADKHANTNTNSSAISTHSISSATDFSEVD